MKDKGVRVLVRMILLAAAVFTIPATSEAASMSCQGIIPSAPDCLNSGDSSGSDIRLVRVGNPRMLYRLGRGPFSLAGTRPRQITFNLDSSSKTTLTCDFGALARQIRRRRPYWMPPLSASSRLPVCIKIAVSG